MTVTWPRYAVLSAEAGEGGYLIRGYHHDVGAAIAHAREVMAREVHDETVLVVEVLARASKEWTDEIGTLSQDVTP
jgi:hypothetical protein